MDRPRIVTLCGSTRFYRQFQIANAQETWEGRMVFSVGIDTKSDNDLLAGGIITPEKKAELDALHLEKIKASDEILVLNCGGYIGSSTQKEIEFAQSLGKLVRYYELHTDQCTKYTTFAVQEQDAWIQQWPNYCKSCSGAGIVHDPGDFYQPPMDDCCSKCTEKGICPRCGAANAFSDDEDEVAEVPCRQCGWNWDKQEHDTLPYVLECECYEINSRPRMKSLYDGTMQEEL